MPCYIDMARTQLSIACKAICAINYIGTETQEHWTCSLWCWVQCALYSSVKWFSSRTTTTAIKTDGEMKCNITIYTSSNSITLSTIFSLNFIRKCVEYNEDCVSDTCTAHTHTHFNGESDDTKKRQKDSRIEMIQLCLCMSMNVSMWFTKCVIVLKYSLCTFNSFRFDVCELCSKNILDWKIRPQE